MTEIANTSWYRTGSVSTTAGSNIITGTNTIWTAAGINPGATFRIETDMTPYEVLAVNSDTEIELRTPYKGTTASGRAYSIDRNHQSTPLANLVADVASVMHKYEAYIDADMQTVTGMSAYEIAVKNGYVGTESEWLTSLIGAGQWDILDDRTEMLDEPAWPLKNALFRGKNLGTAPTAEQLAAIADGSFRDLWLGDYWKDAQGTRWRITHFNYYYYLIQGGTTNTYWHSNDPVTGEKRLINWQPNNYVHNGDEIHDRYGTVHKGDTMNDQYYPPHVIIVPDQFVARGPYYDPEFNADNMFCGYLQSNWYVNIRPAVLQRILDTFGDSHVLEWADCVPTGYTAEGQMSGYVRVYMRCELMTVRHLRGHRLRMDTYGDEHCYDLGKFALYNVVPLGCHEIYDEYTWLRDICGVRGNIPRAAYWTHFAGIRYDPYIDVTESRVFRPYFCLG